MYPNEKKIILYAVRNSYVLLKYDSKVSSSTLLSTMDSIYGFFLLPYCSTDFLYSIMSQGSTVRWRLDSFFLAVLETVYLE